jgi:hypothetical protein
MTGEMDKLRLAKEYLDKLAVGAHPLTGEQLPEDTVLNNVELVRCFFFVSDILRQVIEKRGRVKITGVKQFALTEEDRSRICLFDWPVAISILVRSINEAVSDLNMKKLLPTTVTAWLVEQGYLKVVEDARGRHKDVTPKAREIGIFTEERISTHGPYLAILYDRRAQQFILDNLDNITS